MSRPRADTREGTAPVGRLWAMTAPLSERSRRRKFELFMQVTGARQGLKILDVGAGDSVERSTNFLESWYPWPDALVVCAYAPVPSLQTAYPDLTYLRGDGRRLPFRDGAFDIGFANAVVEHVGSRDEQRAFVHELVRTCRTVFVTTPNRWFPVDPHTLYPFAHWFGPSVRGPIYRRGGKGFWASERNLNPLSTGALRSLFPPTSSVSIVRQRLFGLAPTLVAVATSR